MVKFWAYFDHIHFIKVYKNVCLNTKNLGKQDTFYLYCWHENTSYPKPGLFNDTIRVGMQCSRGHTTGWTELSFLTLITKRRSAKYPCRLGNVFHSPQELQNVQKFCPDISDEWPRANTWTTWPRREYDLRSLLIHLYISVYLPSLLLKSNLPHHPFKNATTFQE